MHVYTVFHNSQQIFYLFRSIRICHSKDVMKLTKSPVSMEHGVGYYVFRESSAGLHTVCNVM